MKAAIICGSGNRDGFTEDMCRSVAEGMRSVGWEVDILRPLDMDIKHCTGCDYCKDAGVCFIKDDMKNIMDSFTSSDLLVMATPIHFSGPSSILKMIIDRFQPFWFKQGKHPKYFAALLCGGSPEPNFNNTVSILKAFSITTDMSWVGALTIPDTDSLNVESISDISFNYGKDLVDSLE